MSALHSSFGGAHRFKDPRRVMLYTAEGLFELPMSYSAHGGCLIGRRNPFQYMKFGDLSLDANPWSVFNKREVMHGAFRPDRPGSLHKHFTPYDLAERALSGGVWVLTNDAVDTGPQSLATRQVLWCVKLLVDPSVDCSECFGHEFLMVVPRTHGLDVALEYVANTTGGGRWGVYGAFAAQMMGSLRQTTSFFCPAQWPLARRVERLDYKEAIFAMSLRPEPLPELRNEEGWLHAPESMAMKFLDDKHVGGSEPFASMASVYPLLFDHPRQDCLLRECDLPTLPDDVLDRIFTIAAHRGLTGNTREDWASHLALRAANSFARDVVRRVSLGIVMKLQTGIASLTPLGATATWSEVRTLREEALRANLHPIEVIMHGDGLDEWTIARIRYKKKVESHPRDPVRRVRHAWCADVLV